MKVSAADGRAESSADAVLDSFLARHPVVVDHTTSRPELHEPHLNPPDPEGGAMTARLHHVAVTVTDMDASIAWYKDLFGFEELVRDEHFGGSVLITYRLR